MTKSLKFLVLLSLLITHTGCYTIFTKGIDIHPLIKLLLMDETNSGREAALNKLPVSENVQKKYGFTEEEIRNYNRDELLKVQKLVENIDAVITEMLNRSLEKEELNKAAIELGLDGYSELEEMAKKRVITLVQISKVAKKAEISDKALIFAMKTIYRLNVEEPKRK